jgi:hypothetical protein
MNFTFETETISNYHTIMKCYKYLAEGDEYYTCQSGRVRMNAPLRSDDMERRWEVNDDSVQCPCYSADAHRELSAMVEMLLATWSGPAFNADAYQRWLDNNAWCSENSNFVWKAWVDKENYFYALRFYNRRNAVSVAIDAFDKAYITDNAIAAHLTNSAIKNGGANSNPLAFARDLCVEIHTQLGDAPAVKELLSQAIKELSGVIHD